MGMVAGADAAGKSVPLVGGLLGGTTTFFLTAAKVVMPLFAIMFIGLWTAAHIFAFYLPAVPLIIWLSACVGWLMLVMEALVSAPLWVIGHAMPEGEGFAGQHGRQGYILVLDVLVRPMLMLMGLLMAMILARPVAIIIAGGFSIFTASSSTNSMPIHSTVAYIVILCGLMVVLTHKLFGLITHLPERGLRWLGQGLGSMGTEGDEGKTKAIFGGFVSRAGSAATVKHLMQQPDAGGGGAGAGGAPATAAAGSAGSTADHAQGDKVSEFK